MNLVAFDLGAGSVSAVRPVARGVQSIHLYSRRLAASRMRDEAMVKKLFDVLGPRYKDRSGGYTRVLKAGFRYGDSAPRAVIELVDRDESVKGAEDKARHEAEQAARESGAMPPA